MSRLHYPIQSIFGFTTENRGACRSRIEHTTRVFNPFFYRATNNIVYETFQRPKRFPEVSQATLKKRKSDKQVFWPYHDYEVCVTADTHDYLMNQR